MNHMPEAIKGYKCPNLKDCTHCDFYDDLCIVYGKKGKKKYKNWLKTNKKTIKNQ